MVVNMCTQASSQLIPATEYGERKVPESQTYRPRGGHPAGAHVRDRAIYAWGGSGSGHWFQRSCKELSKIYLKEIEVLLYLCIV